jgi:hypothetical protein
MSAFGGQSRECQGAFEFLIFNHAFDGRDLIMACPFRKFHPALIRIVRQNHRIIESDVCDPARARNFGLQSVQVATPA